MVKIVYEMEADPAVCPTFYTLELANISDVFLLVFCFMHWNQKSAWHKGIWDRVYQYLNFLLTQ